MNFNTKIKKILINKFIKRDSILSYGISMVS